MNTQKVLPPDMRAISAAAQLFTKSLLLGIDHALDRSDYAADPVEIETLPFEEAIEYMKRRIPMTAKEYYALDDRERFRAFTVSRIADGKILQKVQKTLADSIRDGKGFKDFLKRTDSEILGGVGMSRGEPWYWETVYRTNVQTSYSMGREIGFEQTKPLAFMLSGVDDDRQTETCRRVDGLILKADDPAWDTLTPPLHFNCRTVKRPIHDPDKLPEEYSKVTEDMRPAKGFGRSPLRSDSWWQELPSMKRQAVELGVQQEIERAKERLVREKTTLQQPENFLEKAQFLESIREEDRGDFIHEISKINDTSKKMIQRFGQKMKMDCYQNTNGYYSPVDNKIHFNIKRADIAGNKKNISTFLHETGHWIDHNALPSGELISTGLPNFRAALEQDAISYVNRFGNGQVTIRDFRRNTVEEKSLFYSISYDMFKKGDAVADVSDLFEGITHGKIVDGYGHGKSYWAGSGRLEREAFAEMFCTMAIQGEREMVMKEYFPSAYSLFTKVIGKLLDDKT